MEVLVGAVVRAFGDLRAEVSLALLVSLAAKAIPHDPIPLAATRFGFAFETLASRIRRERNPETELGE